MRASRRSAATPDVLEVCVPVATVWTGEEAPREIDEPALRDEPDMGRWTDSMDTAVRKGLNGRTSTQLLMGEAVRVLDERGDWIRIAAPAQPSSQDGRGYPGWLRRNHLSTPAHVGCGARAYVMTRSAFVGTDSVNAELSFGTSLAVDSVDEALVTVRLPGRRWGTVPRCSVRLSDEPGRSTRFDAGAVLGSARRFLGLRYLWGGLSAWGLDCSGLVHLTYRAHGVTVPRDAFDQAANVDPVPLDQVEPGDLYFFARPGERVHHVGFVSRPLAPDGTRWMLHAPEGGELIEDAPLAPERLDTLVSAGRVRVPWKRRSGYRVS